MDPRVKPPRKRIHPLFASPPAKPKPRLMRIADGVPEVIVGPYTYYLGAGGLHLVQTQEHLRVLAHWLAQTNLPPRSLRGGTRDGVLEILWRGRLVPVHSPQELRKVLYEEN